MHKYQVGDIVLIKENLGEGYYASSYPNELIRILTLDPTSNTLYTFELFNQTPEHKEFIDEAMYIEEKQIKFKIHPYGTQKPIKGSK